METPPTVTAFHNLSDADKNVRDRFYWFDVFNSAIESINATKSQIRAAYIDVLTSDLPAHEQTELHFQNRYLLDEMRVACNRILEFAEVKFPYIEDIFLSQTKETWILQSEYDEIEAAVQQRRRLKICCTISFTRERYFIFDFTQGVSDKTFSVLDELIVFYQEQIENGDFIAIDVVH